jgi:zinc transport system permease protein
MQNAAIAGLLIGILCSILSVFVVLKRLAFIGEGIAHAAFGGIAFAILFNLNIYITTTVFCVVIAVLIGLFSRKGRVSEDSSIGLFLTASMALGVILLNLRKEYTQDIYSYLFGNILSVSREDVTRIIIVGIIVIAFIIYYFKQLQFFTFDEETARVSNVPVNFLYYMLLTGLAVVIVMSVQVVGVILVSALLIIPGTIALLIGKRFLQVVIISVLLGILSTFSGLIASYYAKISTGPAIVVILFLIFIIVFYITKYAGQQSE